LNNPRFSALNSLARANLHDARYTLAGREEELMEELHWQSSITEVKPNELRLRGYRLDELMGVVGFSDAIWLALMGELPAPKVGKLIDAIFVASIDHGATPPSALAAHTVASTGAALNASVAAGILSVNKWHGGAVEDAMRIFHDGVSAMGEKSIDEAATATLEKLEQTGGKVMGYGHRVHTKDPRTTRLFEIAREAELDGRYIQFAIALEENLAYRKKKTLPINVDGAIAAVLCELGVPVELANAFFMISRLPGIVAHAHEEMTKHKPMRRIHPTDHSYAGPEARELPDEYRK
jgi:citrate synthase